jgi:hypothetical protein
MDLEVIIEVIVIKGLTQQGRRGSVLLKQASPFRGMPERFQPAPLPNHPNDLEIASFLSRERMGLFTREMFSSCPASVSADARNLWADGLTNCSAPTLRISPIIPLGLLRTSRGLSSSG